MPSQLHEENSDYFLNTYLDIVFYPVPDGSCQFAAISHQLNMHGIQMRNGD